MAYALDLISAETKNDLDYIRHVRNAFAHARTEVSFDTPEIGNECRKLGLKDYIDERILGRLPDGSEIGSLTNRQTFVATSMFISRMLLYNMMEDVLNRAKALNMKIIVEGKERSDFSIETLLVDVPLFRLAGHVKARK